jgi:hypothetical protein
MTYIEDIPGIESPGERKTHQRIDRGSSTMFEKGIYEIGRPGRLIKQNEDGVNSRKIQATIRERSRKMGNGIAECRRVSKSVSRKVEESCERSMKVAKGGLPSKNKIMDTKVEKGLKRSKRLK